jgi:hypothetical protein
VADITGGWRCQKFTHHKAFEQVLTMESPFFSSMLLLIDLVDRSAELSMVKTFSGISDKYVRMFTLKYHSFAPFLTERRCEIRLSTDSTY